MDGAFCAERKESCDNRLDDLRRYVIVLYEAQEKVFIATKAEQDKALALAKVEMEKGVLLTQTEHNLAQRELEILKEWKSRTEGERSRTVVISWVAVVISLISTVFVAVQGIK